MADVQMADVEIKPLVRLISNSFDSFEEIIILRKRISNASDKEEEGAVEEVDEEEGTKSMKKKIEEVSHEWQLSNKQKPIWLRKLEEITKEECASLYKSFINDRKEHLAGLGRSTCNLCGMRPGTMLRVTVHHADNLRCSDGIGPFQPLAKAWVDKNDQYQTRIGENGGTNPVWNTTLTIPLNRPIDHTTLKIVIVDNRKDGNKKIGSAKLKLKEVKNDAKDRKRILTLKRYKVKTRGHVVVEVLIDGNPAGTENGGKRRCWDRVQSFVGKFLPVVGLGASVTSSVLGVLETMGG